MSADPTFSSFLLIVVNNVFGKVHSIYLMARLRHSLDGSIRVTSVIMSVPNFCFTKNSSSTIDAMPCPQPQSITENVCWKMDSGIWEYALSNFLRCISL